MWQDKLKEIIYILENSNVNEIEINFWGRKYRVSKLAGVFVQEGSELSSNTNLQNPQNVNFESTKKKSDQEINDIQNISGEDQLSPMPGTFYAAPTPDDDPFVSKGDFVKKGQIICIIEAMKIMNEIEAEFDGTIIDINVKNGDPVEYNQSLFVIQPL